MFLKSLEVRGFKSFADKVDLKFKKGITAVVGPNGSGKSNISDSVRWVLGEQSIKTLRGGKMEDVIFAGTQFRKPVGLAQVSLTLDNSEGELPIEYNEVTVTRRIFRSGETEYLLNGTKCRLKDITNLFMDTGIGKEGYSLIGQGKIEAILSGKPEERRSLLEEAAGIVKYKSRKEEAEKKLQNTDNNLIRIRDILSTYEERLGPLENERNKAIKYREISTDLKVKEVSLIVYYISNMEEILNEFNKEIDDKQFKLNLKKEKLLDEKRNVEKLKENIESIEKKNEEARKVYYEKKEKISNSLNEIKIFKERVLNEENLLKRNKENLENIIKKIETLKEEKEAMNLHIEKKVKEQENTKNTIVSLENEFNDSMLKITNMENEIESLKQEEFELLRNNSDIKNEITLINKDIKVRNERIEDLQKSINSINGNIKINLGTLEDLKKEENKNKELINVLNESIIKSSKEISSLKSKLRNKENSLKELNKNLNEFEANKNMLTNLEKHYEGYNRSVKTLMERINKGQIPSGKGTKVLGEILEIDKEYEIAIEIAMGAAISNIITETDSIAKELINYLKNNKLGRATFLPLNNIKGNKLSLDNSITSMEGYIGIAADIIKYPKVYEKAVNNVLGRVIVAKNMDCALKISKKGNNNYRIVTLTGEIIAPGGALTGGSIQSKFTNILGRKREIEELQDKIKATNKELSKELNEIEALRISIKNLDENILNNKDEIHLKNIEITKNQGEIESLNNEIDRSYKSVNVSMEEVKRLKEQILTFNKRLKEREESLNNIQGQNVENKDKNIELQEKLKYFRKSVDEKREKLTEIKVLKASLDETLNNKKEELLRKEREINENTINSKAIKIEEKNSNLKIEELKKEILNKEDFISLENKEILKLEDSFKEDDVKKRALKEKLNEKETIVQEESIIINQEENELNKKELQRAKKEMEKESFYTKLNEELDLTLAEGKEIAVPIENTEAVKDDIISLKRKITALGTVNLASIEEFEEVKEKFEFMSNQEQDLEKAKTELLEVIKEMTDKMKVLFKENFVILNKNFNETFKELFKGGNAELILGEGDELTSNIEINVEPPGKKLQNINLMSGGEKVLSAIALMFAILKMKPTPFCILDEIEAALDDANVYRYAEFLKEFSKNTQFIVITHRKGTMEASDVLYGVTMEEKGVSKVVSVDLTAN
ncbi:MAG: chromosome segregation protein SMC [Clostridium sp.]|nr:chromosome segregation protein SMC [Clostridium sp.]